MNALTQRIAPIASHEGRFIRIVGATAEHEPFLRTLPNARNHRGKWACSPTPLSAWQLRESQFNICDSIRSLALDWDAVLQEPDYERIAKCIQSLKTTPWDHQQKAIAFGSNLPSVLLAIGMGGGKTLTTISLASLWRCRTILVVCPKAVLGVWRREMEKHCNVSHQVAVLDDDALPKKLLSLNDAIERQRQYAVTMVVVNYESSWRPQLAKKLLSVKWDLTVADESHRIADAGSKQSKMLAELGLISRKKLALTGTPMRSSAFCLFGQFKFLEPALFGTSIDRCKNRYFEVHPKFDSKIIGFRDDDRQKEFIAKYSTLTYRVETKDVINLPECVHIRVPVKLNSKTRRMYEKLKKEKVLEIQQGLITASNAAVKLMRLQQVACGHSKTEDGVVVRLGDEKKQVLKDLIKDLPYREPVVVFARFTQDLQQVREIADELKLRYGEVSGQACDLTKHSTMPTNIDVMGVQIRSGAAGIDLTRAAYAFCYSVAFSYADYQQMLARIHRPGQTRTTSIYHLTAANTIDGHVYRSLQDKKDAIDSVLNALKNGEDE